MDYKFVFYGSLMNLDLFYRISGYKPKSIEYGFVHGDLYEATDSTEPMGIHRYPILVRNHGKSIVICVQITLSLTRSELIDILMRLKKFEGDLYKPCIVEFISFKGKNSSGIAYVGVGNGILENSNIKKLSPILGIYLWKF